MESYGEIGRVPVNLYKIKSSFDDIALFLSPFNSYTSENSVSFAVVS